MPRRSRHQLFKQSVYIFVILLPFILLFFRPPSLKSAKMFFVGISSIPIQLVKWPIVEVRKLVSYHQTYDDYQVLKSEVNALRSRLVGLEEVASENNRFEQLLEFKRKVVYATVGAIVIARDPTNWNTSLTINKGIKDGIDIGMPVVNALGVVGKVAEVSANEAKVILVSDPSFSVASIVQRTRESGLISGTLSGLCRLRYLDRDVKVKQGDWVVTSKLSSSFPEGLLIGEVVDVVSNDNSPTLECLVKPAVDLSQVEEVLVVK